MLPRHMDAPKPMPMPITEGSVPLQQSKLWFMAFGAEASSSGERKSRPGPGFESLRMARLDANDLGHVSDAWKACPAGGTWPRLWSSRCPRILCEPQVLKS